MTGIPVMTGAAIRYPLQHGRERRRQVAEPDWLPDRKHPDCGVRLVVQHALNCGGPPQAGGSSRREENNDSDLVGLSVEFTPQRLETGHVQRGERRLTRRHVPFGPEVPAERAEKPCEQDDDDESPGLQGPTGPASPSPP